MIATITTYDQDGAILHRDTREYADFSLLWEHIGCQQNNRRTVRVSVETAAGLVYEVVFPQWTPGRCYIPSRRFHELLMAWAGEWAATE